MAQRYDVVVAGGGPSGSAAAWQAARVGAKVLVVDKAEFPRDKPCGDGLTARAVSYLQKMGLAPQVLQMFEPWFVGLTISITEMTKQGLDPKLGLDAHLAAQAGKAGKPTAGLETGAQQIAFLDGMGKQEQLQFLAEALSQSKDAKNETAKLHDAWREGNAELLWNDMAVKMKQEYPGLYQRINVARNDAWVPKIEKRLADPGTDDTLVVVGALHLLGPDGVVEKLRTKGYTVERVCSACALGK